MTTSVEHLDADLEQALQCRDDLAAGSVPELRAFKRHLWSYVDEYGGSPIGAPPAMFVAYVDGTDKTDVLREHVNVIRRLEMGDRVSLIEQDGEYAVTFHDLEVLHRFLVDIAERARNERDEQRRAEARSIVESFLWLLGYRWV